MQLEEFRRGHQAKFQDLEIFNKKAQFSGKIGLFYIYARKYF